jgi:putative lipoic acid-binding regulatory protein
MAQLPAIELLESVHQFPGPYMFKVIGRTDNGFVARTVAAVRDEVEAEVDPPYRVKETASGRHVSVTLEFTLRDAHQVLAVYRRLLNLAGLVMLL